MSIDPDIVLHTRVPLCAGATAHAMSGGGFSYDAKPDLPGRWEIVDAGHLPIEIRSAAIQAGSTIVPIRGHLSMQIIESVRPMIGSEKKELRKLPIVELSASHSGDLMAVIYSGDGGWRDLDKQVGGVLAKQGVPVIGVDSLRYFWRGRTPDETASDLAAILQQYSTKWKTKHVLLIGYSFGAGILPFAFNRLPENVQRRVVQISLLGLEGRAPFEISISGWLTAGAPASAPEVLPELRRINLDRVQCFYGEEETETLCPNPELAGAEIVRTKGGHHFDGDYQALARRILKGARRRIENLHAHAVH